jgi:hypothetical protein
MAGSPHGGGGFGDPSPGKRGGGGGQQRVSNVCAVTIVQLHSVIPEPTGDGFRMASTGKEVSAVRLVARIVDVNDEVRQGGVGSCVLFLSVTTVLPTCSRARRD